MYRLLLLAVALSLTAPSDLGRAASKEFDFDIVAIDLAARETNLTHDPAVDLAPAVARDGRIAFVSTRARGLPTYTSWTATAATSAD